MNQESIQPGPGEIRTRKRMMRQIVYFLVAAFLGAVIGFFVGFFDQGDGNLFQGDWEELALDPVIALVIAAGVVVSFLILPLWGFRMIDDFSREHNLVAFTAGCLAVFSGFPVWAMLYAGGFAPPPHAFGVWLIAFCAMAVGYIYSRWLR